MESSHSTNGNTFGGTGWYRRRDARTTTCPTASDYSSLSLHRDPESKFDPCSDSALHKLERNANICPPFPLICRRSL